MTFTTTARIPKPAQIGLLLCGTAAAVVAGRLLRKRDTGPSERLALALLDTDLLDAVRRDAAENPELAITACAGYLVQLLKQSAAGAGPTRSPDDAAGASCKRVHPYSGARASVLIERTRPEESLVFALDLDGVCTVRGVRTIGSMRLSGITPARSVQEQVQFNTADPLPYTVQIETAFSVADFVATGSNRIVGEMTLEDSRANTGSLTVQPDGSVSGSLCRGDKTLGRFTGSILPRNGIQYLAFRSVSTERGDERA